MGFWFRKSINLGPIRINLSKSGVGMSTGVKGARVSTGPRGTRFTASKGGFGYTKSLGRGKMGMGFGLIALAAAAVYWLFGR
jgi:hypothetical protein